MGLQATYCANRTNKNIIEQITDEEMVCDFMELSGTDLIARIQAILVFHKLQNRKRKKKDNNSKYRTELLKWN